MSAFEIIAAGLTIAGCLGALALWVGAAVVVIKAIIGEEQR